MKTRTLTAARPKPTVRRVLGWVAIGFLTVGIIGAVSVALLFAHYAGQVPPAGELLIQSPKASQLYDGNDQLLASIYFAENRIPKPLTDISENAIKALIAAEDERFFSHGPIDVRGLIAGLIVDPLLGRGIRGASTLTQQLARQAILHDTDVTIARKIKEIIVAFRLEKQYTKEEVLNMYLNYVYFGSGLYGIEAASLGYFGISARSLDVAQAAMIMGVLPAPSAYSPYENYDLARAQQQSVLRKMVRNRYITQEEADAAFAQELTLKNGLKSAYGNMGWFIDYVKSIVQDQYGQDMLYQGGLRIYTTIDPSLQDAAVAAVTKVWAQAQKDKVFVESDRDKLGVFQPQVGLVSVEPGTGHILAMVGGTDYDETKFNRSLAARQPGSTFKLFDYTAAIDSGATFTSEIVLSQATDFGGWAPPEWLGENLWFGRLSVADAVKESSNIIAAKTSLRTGLDRIIYYARKMGVTSPLKPYTSLSIGSFEVSPLEMAEAYSTIANGGIRVAPYPIRRIETQTGTVVERHDYAQTRVVSPSTAWVIQSMLRRVYENTPNARISGLQAAGKTGSTNDWHDAWFDGFTPGLCTVIHIGNDEAREGMSSIRNAGSRFPAMVWKAYMQQAIKLRPQVSLLDMPEGVATRTVCKDSGLLASNFCPGTSTYAAYFLDSRIPSQLCSVHPALLQTVRLAAIDPTKLAPESWPSDRVLVRTLRRDQIPTETYGGSPEPRPGELTIEMFPQSFEAGIQSAIRIDVPDVAKQGVSTFEILIGESLLATVSGLPATVSWTPAEPGSLTITVIGRTGEMGVAFRLSSSFDIAP